MATAEQKSTNVRAFEDLVKVAAFGGGPIAPLTSWYSLGEIEPIGGYWYFSFNCPSCERDSPLFRDFSDGHLGSPFRSCGVRASCFFCKVELRCASEALRPIQWPLEPGEAPPRSEFAYRVARKYSSDPEYQPLVVPLQHYTSVAALTSILRSKCLWATNVGYLGDTSERELGLARVRQVAYEARETTTGLDAEILTHLLEWLSGPTVESASVYVLSLSRDSNKLSQWRGFTTYGEGVCLAFNSGQLVRRMQAQGWTFQNCRYTQTSQLTWADAILSRIRREGAMAYARGDENRTSTLHRVFQTCLPDLIQVATTIKHRAFVDESEVRFISPVIDIDDKRVRYRTRPGKSTRIPYVEFGLADDEGNVSVEEIMVGPGPQQHVVREAIEVSLQQAGVGTRCRVSVSDTPYRELP